MKKFIKIIARYIPDDLVTYKEYVGKPYYEIMYKENGEVIVGFGSFKIDFISECINKYFIENKISFYDQNGFECCQQTIVNAPTIIEAEADTTRDCKTCGHSNDGKCAFTEECHECMWVNKYIKANKGGEQE